MAATPRAVYLGATHQQAAVVLDRNSLALDGLGKARPTGTRLEFRSGVEQRIPTSRATVDAIAVLVPVLPCEWGLGALLSQHTILLRRELAPPFGIRLLDVLRRVLIRCICVSHCLLLVIRRNESRGVPFGQPPRIHMP